WYDGFRTPRSAHSATRWPARHAPRNGFALPWHWSASRASVVSPPLIATLPALQMSRYKPVADVMVQNSLATRPTRAAATFISMGGPQGHGDSLAVAAPTHGHGEARSD